MQTINETAFRRLATKEGYMLSKSRVRDPDRIEFGGFMLIDPDTNFAVLGSWPYISSADLDEVSNWVTA